jgi:Rho termination factor, N-terminal domain
MAALQRTLENARAGRDIRAEGEDGDELERMTRDQLVERAKEEGLSGRTKMSKTELVEALESR